MNATVASLTARSLLGRKRTLVLLLLPLALLALCTLARVLAGIGLFVAAMTPRRGLGVAAVVGVLLVLSGIQVAVTALAIEFGNDTFIGYAGLLSPFTLVDGLVAACSAASAR